MHFKIFSKKIFFGINFFGYQLGISWVYTQHIPKGYMGILLGIHWVYIIILDIFWVLLGIFNNFRYILGIVGYI